MILFVYFLKIYVFIFWLWVGLHCSDGFSLVAGVGGCFVCEAGLLITVASLVAYHMHKGLGLQWLQPMGCSCGSQALECWLSSCDTAGLAGQRLVGSSGPGMEPVSWCGGFLTTGIPGKPDTVFGDTSWFKLILSMPLFVSMHPICRKSSLEIRERA